MRFLEWLKKRNNERLERQIMTSKEAKEDDLKFMQILSETGFKREDKGNVIIYRKEDVPRGKDSHAQSDVQRGESSCTAESKRIANQGGSS